LFDSMFLSLSFYLSLNFNQFFNIPGPKSYKVPQISKPKFYINGPPDEWQGYNSHKYLPINLV